MTRIVLDSELREKLHNLTEPQELCSVSAREWGSRRTIWNREIVEIEQNQDNQGLLTPEERAEYGYYVTFGTFVAILKSKARQLLANAQGE